MRRYLFGLLAVLAIALPTQALIIVGPTSMAPALNAVVLDTTTANGGVSICNPPQDQIDQGVTGCVFHMRFSFTATQAATTYYGVQRQTSAGAAVGNPVYWACSQNNPSCTLHMDEAQTLNTGDKYVITIVKAGTLLLSAVSVFMSYYLESYTG